MRKLGLAIVALAIAAFASGQAQAQSAKFAADWADDTVVLAEVTTSPDADGPNAGGELMGTIKVPQGWELLIGVSGVANLVTFTEAKGRNNGGEVKSTAEATMDLAVEFAPVGTADVCTTAAGTVAIPGPITFASRIQELTVKVEDFENAEGLVGAVTVALKLDTTAAHHMNFLAVDLDAGEYDVWACFTGEAITTLTAAQIGDGAAKVAIKQRVLTAQQVRAVKESIMLP